MNLHEQGTGRKIRFPRFTAPQWNEALSCSAASMAGGSGFKVTV